MKAIRFLSENFQFLEVKFSSYLNRRAFVMKACMSYANIESPDKHAHQCSLFRVFSVRQYSLQYITKTRLLKYIENFTTKN